MINGYAEHAANERTFLAWVRTGIAVIAFGLVVEKLDLFIRAALVASPLDPADRLQALRSAHLVWRYDGLALVVLGLAIILLQTVRFARTSRMLDDEERHHVSRSSGELMLSTALAALVAVFASYLLFA
jgi:putative membrane protein